MYSGRPVAGSPEHKSMWQRQLVTVAIVLGVILLLLLAALYVCLFRSVPLRISKKTTFVTAPLKPGGKEVDYFAAWVQEHSPKIMATDENGYRLIVRHLGLPAEVEPERVASLCERLGLRPEEIQADVTFQAPREYLEAYVASRDYDQRLVQRLIDEQAAEEASLQEERGEQEIEEEDELDDEDWEDEEDEWYFDNGYEQEPVRVLEERLGRPWTLDDLPMMATWLADNAEALDLVAHAANLPEFVVPATRGPDKRPWQVNSPAEMSRLRLFAYCLHARSEYSIAMGDLDRAINDILAIRRLGRHLRSLDRAVPMLVGIASEGIGTSLGIGDSLNHPPTEKQISRLLTESGRLSSPGGPSKLLRIERFMILDEFQKAALAGRMPSLYTAQDEEQLERFGYDWNTVAQRTNECFDAFLAGSPLPPVWLQPIDRLSIRKRSLALADAYLDYLPGWYDCMKEAGNRQTCAERIQVIALAMLLYHHDHGTLPPAYTVDAQGNPLHSWRVLLLPYLGQQALYDKIRLDEPWDSPHNRAFHEADVPVYQCPTAALAAGRTTYSVVVGPDMPFDGAKANSLSQFGPKSANMILVVERRQDLCWMEPGGDVSQEAAELGCNRLPEQPDGIASQHPGGANYGLRSGAACYIGETIDEQVFQGLLRGTTDRLP